MKDARSEYARSGLGNQDGNQIPQPELKVRRLAATTVLAFTAGSTTLVEVLALRVQLAAVLLSTSILLSTSCPNNIFQQPVYAKAASLSAILDDSGNSSDQLAAQLREFQDGASEHDKAEASYVLARLLQKNTHYDANVKDTKANGTDALMEAMRLYDDASASIPSLAERSAWHIADIAGTIGDEDRVRAALEYLKKKSNSAQTKTSASYALAQSYVRTKDNDKAQALFLAIRKNSPDSEFAKGSAYYLAEMAMSSPQPTADDIASAAELYRGYVKASPDGRFVMEAVNRLHELDKNGSIKLTPSDHESIGQAYFTGGHWSLALDEWHLAKPDSQLLKQAICYANTSKKDDAMQTLLQAIRAHPTISYEATAALISNLLNREDTKKFWQQIAQANPTKGDAPLWNVALRSKPQESMPLYRALITNYPTSEYAPEAIWWLFWESYKEAQGNPQKLQAALVLARKCTHDYPTTKAAAKLGFWAGKIDEHLHHPADAKLDYQFTATHFPSYYYGHRAKSRLRALAAKSPNSVADPATDTGWTTKVSRVPPNLNWAWSTPQDILEPAQIEKKYGATFAELLKLHQFDECLELLPHDADAEFKATIYAKLHRPLNAINSAGRDIEGSPKLDRRWMMAYPLEFAGTISSDAKANGLDPLLVHALIREESRYNSDALSRSKAIGLMQLMPFTALGVAKRLGVPMSGANDAFSPAINIKLGTNYLAYTIKRFQGNALLAVASYNGGPNAVQSWFNQHKLSGSSDFDVFVENIPFRETRDYVRKVFGSFWTYEEIYSHKKI